MIEAAGVLHEGAQLIGRKGFRRHLYEVITPGIDDGRNTKVLIGRVDKDSRILRSYMVPQDVLTQALLLKARAFRGYELVYLEKDSNIEDTEWSFSSKLRDEAKVLTNYIKCLMRYGSS